jgi:hypothetical protein
MKKLISKEILLTFTNFNKAFEIHTGASKVQLRTGLKQEGKSFVFHRKIQMILKANLPL